MHPDAATEPYVDRRCRLVDVPPAARDEPHGERANLGLIGGPGRLTFGTGAAIDPETARSVDEEVGDGTGCREWRERPENGEIHGGIRSGHGGRRARGGIRSWWRE